MNKAPKEFWTIAIIGIMVVVLGLMLVFNYNSVDTRDPVTMLVVAISGICVWVIKMLYENKAVQKEQTETLKEIKHTAEDTKSAVQDIKDKSDK